VKVIVIIPAFNEEKSIAMVLQSIPKESVHTIIVVNNGSTDNTAQVARQAGADVVHEARKGYGNACLAGIEYGKRFSPDAVVFLDADYSDHPPEMPVLLNKINEGYDLVIGSRKLGNAEKGALLPQARWGNWLAVSLIRLMFGYTYTDLGPFRAVKWDKLLLLKMHDRTFGWTVEMQVKAIKAGLRITEVPVSYRKRIGVSKVTGTISGTIRAGYKILFTILKYALKG
jgi:glycosyltransferase involved in cell wall biosynthesis